MLEPWFTSLSGKFMLVIGYEFIFRSDSLFVLKSGFIFGSRLQYRFVFVLNVCPVQVHFSVRLVLKFVFTFTSKFVHVTFTPYSARNCQIRVEL